MQKGDRQIKKKFIAVAALLALTWPIAVAAATAELAGQVRAAETAFAKTMTDRDWAAFKTCIAAEASFLRP